MCDWIIRSEIPETMFNKWKYYRGDYNWEWRVIPGTWRRKWLSYLWKLMSIKL
jgi:hypothetical protein